MLAPFALVSVAMGALVPVMPAPQEGDGAAAVGREIAMRSAAPELGRLAVTSLGTGASVTRAQLRDLLEGTVDPAAPPWVSEVSALDAAARAGLLLVDDQPDLLPERRPELWAAALRVLDTRGDGPALAAAISAGLAAPFHVVRLAAMDRLARGLISNPELAPLLPMVAATPGLTKETCGELGAALARAGARSEALAESALLARTRALEGDASRALAELFDLWLDRPVSAEAVRFLRQRFPARGIGGGLVEALAMVAELDPNLPLRPVDLDAVMMALDVPLADLTELGGELERFRDGLDLDEWDLDERSERVARRSRSAVFGRAMLGRTTDGGLSSRSRQRCVQAAAWTLPMAELLPGARALGEAEAEEVWRILSDRLEPLPPEELGPWLADPREGIRDAAAREVGRRLTLGGELELLPVAVELLDDVRPEVRGLAFSWLCESARSPEVWGALRAAFDREGVLAASNWRLTARQMRWLAQLPRGVRIPAFKDLLMELVGRAKERSPAIVELLGPFLGDRDVAALLRRALEEELRAVEEAPVYPARLMPDGRAAAIASSLAAVEGAAATEVLVDGLRRSMMLMHGPDAREDARPQLPKVTCGLLQRSAAGRAALVEFLGDRVPVRVRYEAALQLAKAPDLQPEVAGEVARRVTADFERVDGTLRARGLQALGRLPGPQHPDVERFLRRLSAPGGDAAEREMAIAVMGSWTMVATLVELSRRPLEGGAPDLMDVEAAVAAVRALADPAMEPRPALGELLELVEATDARLSAPGIPELEGEALRQLRGVALIGAATVAARDRALASGRPVPLWLRLAAAVTRRPMEEGPSDIARRFRGEELGAVRFRWSAEVGAVEALPALTREFLPEGVGASAEDGVDGRLLVMLGELSRRMGRGGVEAQRLLEHGLFAMAGEPRTRSASRDLTFGRAALGRTILDGFGSGPGPGAGDQVDALRWERAALQAALLLVDWRRGRIGRAVLEAEFGVADAGLGCDPEARLAALNLVFRGRAALARGEAVEVARGWAARARDWAALDRLATDALAALDEATRLRQR